MNLKRLILSQFEPDIASSLIEFSKEIAQVRADAVMFMARKSFCLYDALVRVGFPPVEPCVLSDRVLDLQMNPLKNKRIALIDDTLILGTSLAKAKRKLEKEYNAKVTVRVFCTDKTWWCRELIRPSHYQMMLDDHRIMTFCTAEIRALSLIPRPYVVDFPITQPLRLNPDDLPGLLSLVEWKSYRVSTRLQEENNVSVYTFVPTGNTVAEFAQVLGDSIVACIDILKVRAFARRHNDKLWVQLVPIVTLKPLTESHSNALFNLLVDRISEVSEIDLSRLLQFAVTPRSKQRISQYFLSAALGKSFMKDLAVSLNSFVEVDYDDKETDVHYGPWIHEEMKVAGQAAHKALVNSSKTHKHALKLDVQPAALPLTASAWARETFLDLNTIEAGQLREQIQQRDGVIVNLFAELTALFLRSYDRREIRAREEARKLGRRILDASSAEAPSRDRLEIGIAWDAVKAYFREYFSIGLPTSFDEELGIALDICNDLGIAVPVTCEQNGVVFRAYRHGEDVKFSDSELALVQEAVKGLLDSTGRDSIPHLVLEKLLSLMIKVGTANRFLEPLFGTSGFDGVARIGFDLKGARALLVGGARDRADRNMWLTTYLLDRGILELAADDRGLYRLKMIKPIEGNYLVHDAPDKAYELGHILGSLIFPRRNSLLAPPPLGDEALTILVTCWPPRHAAQALQVELDIFSHWFKWDARSALESVDWDNPESIKECITTLVQGRGHEAIHAAKLKFLGYKTRRASRIASSCHEFLNKNSENVLVARTWKSYWNALKTWEVTGERKTFEPWINQAGLLCWELAIYLCSLEILLRAKHASILLLEQSPELDRAYAKMTAYHDGMSSSSLRQPSSAQKLVERLLELRSTNFDGLAFDEAFTYALRGISKRLQPVDRFVESIEPIVTEFGKLQGLRQYKYLLYYDLKDSSGNKTGAQGEDADAYRSQVRLCKNYLSNAVQKMSRSASRARNEVFCWNGSASSENDAKHVFIKGKSATSILGDLIEILGQVQSIWNRIHCRIVVVPCNFAGSSAYRYDSEPEVRGERFWEHLSRLLEKEKDLEKEKGSGSFLLIATEALIASLRMPRTIEWQDPSDGNVTSEIALLKVMTKVRYGVIVRRSA